MITAQDHSEAPASPSSTAFTTQSARMKMATAEKLVASARIIEASSACGKSHRADGQTKALAWEGKPKDWRSSPAKIAAAARPGRSAPRECAQPPEALRAA